MTTASDSVTDPISVTANAIIKVHQLMEEEQNFTLKLRIFVTGGGCSGFQYGFSFEETSNDDDFLIEKTLNNDDSKEQDIRIQILIDAMSMQYLTGAEIDYRKDINGEQFIIRGNPNAKTTCGCGSSFAADEK